VKLWSVTVVQPKQADLRRARFQVVYTVHAKSSSQARKAMMKSVYVAGGETIVKIREDKTVIQNARYFGIAPDADVS